MQKYQSHKVVEAAKITGFDYDADLEGKIAKINWIDVEGKRFENVPNNIFARGEPDLGDYLVRYEDGYLSWSPKEPFEAGYSLIEEAA